MAISSKNIILIVCMALVTYIPRALPAVFAGKIKLGAKAEKFLNLIPYTAMAALIFPGIFSVDETNVYIGIAGAAAAALLAWKKAPVILCVIAAICVDLIIYCFIK